LRVPEDVGIIGGSGLPADERVISATEHDFRRISEELLDLASARILQDGKSLPGVLIPASFSPGTSTSAAENRQISP
jgi:hypothetical protein